MKKELIIVWVFGFLLVGSTLSKGDITEYSNNTWLRASFTSATAEVIKMDDVLYAARAGFHHILERVPLESAEHYGFYSLEGLARAELGIPIPVYTVEANEAQVVPVNQWRVPVMVDDSYRALLTVAYFEGSLKAVALGGRDLSQEFQSAQGALGGGNRQPLALLRLYSLRIDFVFDPSSLDASGPLDRIFYPLKSARSRLGIDRSVGFSEIMNFIDQ